MNSDDSHSIDSEEYQISRLLRAAGPRQELPEALKTRWEETFRNELKLRQKQRQRRRYTVAGLAAAFVALGLATLLSLPSADIYSPTVLVANISGNAELEIPGKKSDEMHIGQRLYPGSTLTTGPAGFAAIEYGVYDIRLNSRSKLSLHADGIILVAGEIYVSDEGSSAQGNKLKVITPYGDIEDIGTQFTVKMEGDRVTSTVRRGTVVVILPSKEYRAEAESGIARQIVFDEQQHVQFSDRSPAGPEWEWIYHSSGGYVLEGKSVFEFLQWSAMESGIQVDYASEGAQIYARLTTLHGDIEGMSPNQAIEPVLASTHLRVEKVSTSGLKITLEPR